MTEQLAAQRRRLLAESDWIVESTASVVFQDPRELLMDIHVITAKARAELSEADALRLMTGRPLDMRLWMDEVLGTEIFEFVTFSAARPGRREEQASPSLVAIDRVIARFVAEVALALLDPLDAYPTRWQEFEDVVRNLPVPILGSPPSDWQALADLFKNGSSSLGIAVGIGWWTGEPVMAVIYGATVFVVWFTKPAATLVRDHMTRTLESRLARAANADAGMQATDED